MLVCIVDSCRTAPNRPRPLSTNTRTDRFATASRQLLWRFGLLRWASGLATCWLPAISLADSQGPEWRGGLPECLLHVIAEILLLVVTLKRKADQSFDQVRVGQSRGGPHARKEAD